MENENIRIKQEFIVTKQDIQTVKFEKENLQWKYKNAVEYSTKISNENEDNQR